MEEADIALAETYKNTVESVYMRFGAAGKIAIDGIKAYVKAHETPENTKYCSDILHILAHINQTAVSGMLGKFAFGAAEIIPNIERLRARQNTAPIIMKTQFGESVEAAARAAIEYADAFVEAAGKHHQCVDEFMLKELERQKTATRDGVRKLGE